MSTTVTTETEPKSTPNESYTIIFVGIVNFFELKPQGRRVLMPDGTNPPDGIDPHHANIYVAEAQVVDASNWWPRIEDQTLAHEDKNRSVHIFRIEEPSLVEISGIDGRGDFDASEFEGKVVRLKDIDEKIDIDPATAKTIAQIPIRAGKLMSRRIKKTGLVAQLDVVHEGDITITARPVGTSTEKTLVLKAGTELVIGNLSDGMKPHPTDDEKTNHFRLYGLLDSKGSAQLPPPTPARIEALEVTELTSFQPFIRHIRDNFTDVPDIQCIVTGCCR